MSNRNLFRRVLELVEAGDKAEARRLVGTEINHNPGNADAWAVMARLCDDRDRAIYYLEHALELRPHDARLRGQLQQLRTVSPAKPVNQPRRGGLRLLAQASGAGSGAYSMAGDDFDTFTSAELVQAAVDSPAYLPASGRFMLTLGPHLPEPRRLRLDRAVLPALLVLIGVLLVGLGRIQSAPPAVQSDQVEVVYRATLRDAESDVLISYRDSAGLVHYVRTRQASWTHSMHVAPGDAVRLTVHGDAAGCEIAVDGMPLSRDVSEGGAAVCEVAIGR